MKQEVSTSDSKASSLLHSPAPADHARISRLIKNSPKPESANGVSPGSKARPKPAPADPSINPHKVRRSILQNKVKQGGEDEGASKGREIEDPKIAGRLGDRTVEQYARPRRPADANCKGSDHNGTDRKKTVDLQKRLDASERMVKDLQSEVSDLKAQLEKLQSQNVRIESQNKHLVEDLSNAEAKVTALERCHQASLLIPKVEPSEFKNVKNLISNKLARFKTKEDLSREDSNAKIQSLELKSETEAVEFYPKLLAMKPLPSPPVKQSPATRTPPPPPPPPPVPTKGNTMQRTSALVELYHSLTKRDEIKSPMGIGNRSNHATNYAQNSIVGELQNRSAHLLAIKADVQTKADFIKHLIERVQSAAYTDVEDVLNFVDWLDGELCTLADERAVLKHFSWPESKADALREAAFEYRALKRLEDEVSSFEDDASLPCDSSLKKIDNLLDKLERSINRLIKLRGTSMLSYRELKIPTDWMLDSGMVSKMKLASVKLAKIYMKRVSTELELLQHSERELTHDVLLFQGVRFAYRAHQFAGALDPETMHAFEELRERIRAHEKGSGELIPGISVS